MKIVTVVGARPQLIKAAPVSKKIREKHVEILVHTGQHYDERLSDVFFEELGLPVPDYSLGVGSGNHGAQTGQMLQKVEQVLLAEKADWCLVYGDTNSTLAGALAAVKIHIPVFHVEAGMRSYNRKMPEEVNRVVTDHVSTVLACPTAAAVRNLSGEGFANIVHGGALWNPAGEKAPAVCFEKKPLVVNIGDVMLDAVQYFSEEALARSNILTSLGLREKCYILATVHRAENTDCPGNLRGVLEGLQTVAQKVVLPLHPRTEKKIRAYNLQHLLGGNILIIKPVGYLDMLALVSRAALVITDSGGLQKETFMLGTRCITLRDETEWVETVEAGGNTLAGLGAKRLDQVISFSDQDWEGLNPYGDGRAAERVANLLG